MDKKLFRGELVIPVEMELFDYFSRKEVFNQFQRYAENLAESGNDALEAIANANVRVFNIDKEKY